MEIIVALGLIMLNNSITSPSWGVMVFQVLFFILSVILASPRIANDLNKMRKDINERM